MSIRMLLAPFLFILLFCTQIVLMPSDAFAQFCGCGNCWMATAYPGFCFCGGSYPTCLEDDSNVLQTLALTDNRPPDTSSIPEGLMSSVEKTDVTERVMNLMSGGKCFRDKVALSLLGNARESLKFVPVRFDEKNTVAFLIDADQEK